MPQAGARQLSVPPAPPRQLMAKSYRRAPHVPLSGPSMSSQRQRFQHIAFVAGQTPEARQAYERLEKRYGNADPAKADVIVALGGDGLMLQTLHKIMNSGKPIYGMPRGTVGFLMNEYSVDGLAERIAAAHITIIHPLVMRARDAQGRTHE